MTQKVTTEDLAAFVVKLQAFVKAGGSSATMMIEPRQKYAVIVASQGAGARSSYGFIDLATGDLLKAASWKTPAKGVRGNIYAENPLAGCTPWGMQYNYR